MAGGGPHQTAASSDGVQQEVVVLLEPGARPPPGSPHGRGQQRPLLGGVPCVPGVRRAALWAVAGVCAGQSMSQMDRPHELKPYCTCW